MLLLPPSLNFVWSITGKPRKRSGRTGASAGNGKVLWPCFQRWISDRSIIKFSEIVSAVGQVEALVAKGKIRDLLPAQRQGEPAPVMERGIDYLVQGETARFIGESRVTDFSAPAFDQ